MLRDFSYMYPAFPILGSISIFMCMLSVPAHIKVGNIAVVSLALWTSIGLLILVIDSCVWHGNIRNPHPIWGDIVQQYFVMMPTGLAVCALCFQYRLWSIVRTKSVFITKRERTIRVYASYFFCIGIPIIVGVLHYAVQGHRYDLIEDLGPFTTIYVTPMAIGIYLIWEPLFVFIAGIYGIHTLALFLARRKEMDVALNSGSININKDRYLRLMCLAMVSFVIHFPISLLSFIGMVALSPIHPWISWEDTHSNYGRIEYITRFMFSLFRPESVVLTSINWWALVLCGFNFFIFFGLGEEATKQYRFWLRIFLRPFGIEYPKENSRDRVKRTWLDVLLCRPGQPVFSKSGSNHVIGHLSVDPAETRPSDYETASIQSREERDSVGVRSAGPDRPGSANAKHIHSIVSLGVMGTMTGGVEVGQHRMSMTQADIPDPAKSSQVDQKQDSQQKLSLSLMELKVETDLEAQQGLDVSIGEQRRKEILEKNPELTEEIFF